ncbi:D-hexose-6-phosphate mutarotase [Aquipseudomonas ullengensis]|uniref:Putative glucose-6-phosphate 1-epimerase n=1 Tax=Aquipseudomonas ullengensis TaxID=2759166 RepID=A0A7W4LJB2_9GAMM|nr:D-hexose-6-phosphate mutarotase [Pseudomonas ullengensis]MBB2494166.1 D-hexose-6-phosphate mutarotase [Pseudomonas ullengensis]
MSQAQIERVELDQLTCWRVHLGDAELLIAQQGAQVLHYQRAGQPPLIWLSEQAGYQHGQSVRGGVPVCWPWFGDLQRNPAALQAQHGNPATAPAHGGVRGLDWQLQGIDNLGDAVELLFSFDSRQHALPDWPHAAELQLRIRLDQRLQLQLTSRNLGDQPLALSQALHSYFAVSDIRQVSVEGLDGCRYIETLEDWQQRTQQGALSFAGETDRIYLDVPPRVTLHDTGWQRRIHLEAQDSRSAVLWNPWIDKAQRLSHFADDAWQRMLCIETANVWDDCVELAPGASHSLTLSLWGEPA